MLGQDYVLKHVGGRGTITREGNVIQVPGDEAFMARRVRDWLKAQARERIAQEARQKAQALGKTVRQVTVRDTVSRWGSCSHDGNLSFSWRLILAPAEVCDYVISHEVAHLQEFNHSAAFWALVEQLSPGYRQWRNWLSVHGHGLYAYGATPPPHQPLTE